MLGTLRGNGGRVTVAPWRSRIRTVNVGLAFAVLGIASLAGAQAPAPARAATNGRIAFEVPPDSTPRIDTIAPDGTAQAPFPGLPRNSANAAWSADGTSLAFSSTVAGRPDIYVIKADGTGLRRVTQDPAGAIDPTWSPDDRQIAFTSLRNGVADIWVADLDTGAIRQLTVGAAVDQEPRWSPDGKLIAFSSNRTGPFAIWVMAADGSNQHELTSPPGQAAYPTWNPNGQTLAYTNEVDGRQSLYAIDLTGGAPRRLTVGDGTDQFPAWSPDGSQIAFVRAGSLMVMPASGDLGGNRTRLLTASGVDPVWAPLPPPVVSRTTGTVTVVPPGSSAPVPASSAPALPTGTQVNATNGGLLVSFKLQAVPATVPPSTARVQNAAFTIARRTPTLLTLSLKPPLCSAGSAAARRSGRRATVRVRRGHFGVITNQVIAASHLTDYVVTYSCRGTRVTVTKGLVLVRLRHPRRRRRGGRGLPTSVPVRAGHSFFAGK